MVRIVLADDHQLILDGLKALINDVNGFEVVGVAANGKQLLDLVSAVSVDVALVDIDMPVMSGLEAIKAMMESGVDTKCIALTMHNEKGMIQKVMQAGAKGYVLKNIDQDDLIETIRRVQEGEEVLGQEVKQTLKTQGQEQKTSYQNVALGYDLTDREMELLRLIALGMSNKEIGEALFISHRTVDTHRTNLMKKLNVHNIAGLIRYAFGVVMLSKATNSDLSVLNEEVTNH